MTLRVLDGIAPKREEHTFAELVEGREEEFPTLAAAVQCVVPATSVRIEWLVDGPTGTETWHNYQQIWRYPYACPVAQGSVGVGGVSTLEEAHGESLTKFLASIEQTLVYGSPGYSHADYALPLATCGGTRHYLGRDIVIGDHISLRPLQEPFLWTHDWDYVEGAMVALDNPHYEWLCETSLEVRP